MALCTATFETGINGNNVATTDTGSATPFNALVKTGGGFITYSNTHVANGALAGNFGAAGSLGQCAVIWSTSFGTVTDHYGRMYLYMTALPSGQLVLTWCGQGTTRGARIDVTPGGKLAGFDNPAAALFTTFATSVALNQWVRVEYHIVHSATVGQGEVKLFNDAGSSVATETQTGTANKNTLANADNIRVGTFEGNIGAGESYWMDNIVAGANSYPGIFSESSVQNLPPVIYGRGAC